uniref:Uncharacterized protein n=2 Tax=Corethron hystrix TaxID=216773 RepID=A0A6U5IGP4_9STRA|mmetsp:Transcript_33728/g.77850  ORF Transcript_33728/g.77850 Transcript_33728/m.77850 type:complete len:717 (+) Transcript_33728:972-3122(+)|eukprot:CAMPEP_0113308696 /NCGR_PEP_ID=MMETSP0010_2-20120614/7042_1 /TAXON_ID=216773 ORGANISM="Corethron hystrix, Strain 308" /NCGR_SAMPLE_ID=MMETSP0010_2 /ASSEMBLY_ACC=CAM_ASM_000155 /LENGTH=716 /DNA_ID=CAMNT_0000163811 /DNA_START=49 /DNA_END=2199 /DNA_ORIENTATION=- /assembly_acc=CAM_ASM_000155
MPNPPPLEEEDFFHCSSSCDGRSTSNDIYGMVESESFRKNERDRSIVEDVAESALYLSSSNGSIDARKFSLIPVNGSSSNAASQLPDQNNSLPIGFVTLLLHLCNNTQWDKVIIRASSHPHEAIPQAPKLTAETALSTAIALNAPLSALDALVRAHPPQLLQRDDFQSTVLHRAVDANLPGETIRYLIDADKTYLQSAAAASRDENGHTPLHLLVVKYYYNRSETIKGLMQELVRSCPFAVGVPDVRGWTPLTSVLIMSWKWYDEDDGDDDGDDDDDDDDTSEPNERSVSGSVLPSSSSAAGICSSSNPTKPKMDTYTCAENNEWIESLTYILVTAHPPAASMVCPSGYTPLHEALLHHRPIGVIRSLLEVSPASALVKNWRGELPLQIAIMMRVHMDILRLLLMAGPSAVTSQDKDGLTPIHWAWIKHIADPKSHEPVGQYVSDLRRVPEEYGSLVERTVSEFESAEGEVLMGLTAGLGSFWPKVELMLRVVQQGTGKFRVVHAAALTQCAQAILRMARVMYPQQLREKDEKGRLPLHLAASRADIRWSCGQWQSEKYEIPVVDKLLKLFPRGSRVSDNEGRLPLHIAIERERRQWMGISDTGKNVRETNPVGSLLNAYPASIGCRDGKTKLYPFMMAAIGDVSHQASSSREGMMGITSEKDNAILTRIFMLLRAEPSLVETGMLSQESSSGEQRIKRKLCATRASGKGNSRMKT